MPRRTRYQAVRARRHVARPALDAEASAWAVIDHFNGLGNPPCPGPVVVHADGVICCQAPGCGGTRYAHHSTVHACRSGMASANPHECDRCAHASAVAA
jgi:hypothetical protein